MSIKNIPRHKREDELLTPDEAAELLNGKITAQAIRKRVREKTLRCYRVERTPGKVFVKRTEVLKVYSEKIHGWGIKE